MAGFFRWVAVAGSPTPEGSAERVAAALNAVLMSCAARGCVALEPLVLGWCNLVPEVWSGQLASPRVPSWKIGVGSVGWKDKLRQTRLAGELATEGELLGPDILEHGYGVVGVAWVG